MNKDQLIDQSKRGRAVLPKLLSKDLRNRALELIEEALCARSDEILKANQEDLENAEKNGLSTAMKDRLLLNRQRLFAVAKAVGAVKNLPDPLRVEETFVLENGLQVSKNKVPLGVIAMIYEARPNVTVDAAALAIRSGNTVILRGGKEALFTNRALVKVMREALATLGLAEAVYLIDDTDRETVDVLLSLRGYIDLVIPEAAQG